MCSCETEREGRKFYAIQVLQLPCTLDTETKKDKEHRGEKKRKGVKEKGHKRGGGPGHTKYMYVQ